MLHPGATKVTRLLRYKTKLGNCARPSDSFARTVLRARLQRARRQVDGAADKAAQGVPLFCERLRGFGGDFGETGKFPTALRAQACRLNHAWRAVFSPACKQAPWIQ